MQKQEMEQTLRTFKELGLSKVEAYERLFRILGIVNVYEDDDPVEHTGNDDPVEHTGDKEPLERSGEDGRED